MKQKLLKIIGVVVAAILLVVGLVAGYRADKSVIVDRQKITLVYMSGDNYPENLSALREQGYSFIDEKTFDKLVDQEENNLKRTVYSTEFIRGSKVKCFMPDRLSQDTVSVVRGTHRVGRGGKREVKVPPGYYAVVAPGD